jgi:EmrB/QacA subfamily drug resistance transporter
MEHGSTFTAGGDAPDATAPDPRRWITLGVLCLSLTLVMVSNMSLNVALPSMARTLDASSSDLQWIVDAYALVFAGMLFAAGTLGDRFGRKGALQVGLGLFVVGAFGGVLAQSSGQVIAVRAIMGLGAAFVMPSTLSILTNVFPAHERPRAISLWAGVAAGGAALGPPLSGLLLEHFWWGSVFLVTLPISLLALALGHRFVPTSRDPAGTRIDIPGALLSIVGIGAAVYAIIEAPHEGWLSSTTLAWGAASALAIVAFVLVEHRSSHPMLDLNLFSDRRFSVSAMGIGLAFFTMFGVFFLMTQFFQLVHGMSPVAAGSMMLPVSFTMMLVAPRAPRLVTRFGVVRVVPVGLFGVALGLVLMSIATHASSVWWSVPVMMLMSAGMAVTMSPLTTLIMAATPLSRAGMGSATNDATRELGGALGVAVLGSVASTLYINGLPALEGLDAPLRAEARSGLAGAISVATRTGAPIDLIEAAQRAFVNGLSVAMVVGAGLAATAALLAARLLPRPAGRVERTAAFVDPAETRLTAMEGSAG